MANNNQSINQSTGSAFFHIAISRTVTIYERKLWTIAWEPVLKFSRKVEQESDLYHGFFLGHALFLKRVPCSKIPRIGAGIGNRMKGKIVKYNFQTWVDDSNTFPILWDCRHEKDFVMKKQWRYCARFCWCLLKNWHKNWKTCSIILKDNKSGLVFKIEFKLGLWGLVFGRCLMRKVYT